MHIRNGHKIFFFCMLADNSNQIIQFSGLSKKDLTLSIHDIFLQIYSDGFSHTEILHRLGNGHAQFFTQVKEMVDRRTGCKNNGRMIQNRNFLLSELLRRKRFYFNEWPEVNLNSILLCNVEIRGLLGCRLRL